MDIWVRSQNKEKLVKVNKLSLYDSNILKNYFVLNDKPNYSSISIIANDNYNLGSYKSKERALEVLDEIQKLINPKILINVENFNTNDARVLCDKFKEYSPVIVRNDDIKIESLGFIIYEMPKE